MMKMSSYVPYLFPNVREKTHFNTQCTGWCWRGVKFGVIRAKLRAASSQKKLVFHQHHLYPVKQLPLSVLKWGKVGSNHMTQRFLERGLILP